MKFTENTGLLQRFVASLRESYGERPEIHVSDLIYCLREAYYRKVKPKPHTETQLMYFLDGARRHRALQSLSDARIEEKVEGLGIVGTIDILGEVPVEFKSTRASKSLPAHYFKQLGYYCLLTGQTRGILAVQRINNREQPFEFYDVEYTAEDLEEMTLEIEEKRSLLALALEDQNPRIVPKTAKSWKCKNCLYQAECEEASA